MNCNDYRDHVRRIEIGNSGCREMRGPHSYAVAGIIAVCGVMMACFLAVPCQSARMPYRAPPTEHYDSRMHLRDDSPFLWLSIAPLAKAH